MYKNYRDLGSNTNVNPNTTVLEEIQNLQHKKQIVNNNKIVLVNIHASWCGPCKQIAPQVVELADKYKGVVKVVKEDADKKLSPEVRGVPTFHFYYNKEMVHSITGGDMQKIQMMLNQLVRQS